MLQDIPPPTLREAGRCVLETERLTLRRPTLADVNAIARLADDRRIAVNTRLPHPYSQNHAVEFVRHVASKPREAVFLLSTITTPIGMVGADWRGEDTPELGILAGGGTIGGKVLPPKAARAGDRFHLRGVRHRLHPLGRAGHQPRFAQHSGEMRLPVVRRGVASLRVAGIVGAGRLLSPDTRRLGVAEELEQFDAPQIAIRHVSTQVG